MIYVAELVVAVDDAGTVQTLLFATQGFCTGPSDTPANTVARERLAQPLNYSRTLDPVVPIGLVTTGYGECVLLNPDGALDAMARHGVANRAITLRASVDGSGAYPGAWTTLLVAAMERIEASNDTLRIIVRDASRSVLDVPVCSRFGGTGGLDGSAALYGTPKPRIYGQPLNAPLTVINDGSGSNIYMVSDKPYASAHACFDGRYWLTPAAPDVADYATLAGTSVSSGEFRRSVTDSIVKLGSVPTYTPTTDPYQTDATPSYHIATGLVLLDLLSDAGISEVMSGLSSISWGGLGYWARDTSTTYAAILNEFAISLHAYAWFDRAGVFRIAQWDEPSTSAWTYTTANSFDLSIVHASPFDPVSVIGPRNFNPSPLSDTATGVDLAWRNSLTKDYVYSDSETAADAKHDKREPLELRYVGYSNNLSGVMKPNVSPSGTALYFQGLFGSARDVITLVAPVSLGMLSAVDIGSEVTVQWPRYGFDAGVFARVSGLRYDLSAGTITVTMWR